MVNDLFANLHRLHTTELGEKRIRNNLGLDNKEDAVAWCKRQIENSDSITRTGKNWYARGDGFVITVNANSFTIITARRERPKGVRRHKQTGHALEGRARVARVSR